MNSRITQAISDLHALFAEELEGVSFPDIDGEVLLSLQSKVDSSRAEVERCEEALDAANRAREVEEEALLKAAILAQKYMRIFASDNEELLEQVEGLELEDKPTKKKTRKTRKAKAKSDSTIALALDEPKARENAA